MELHYKIAGKFKPDAHLIGSNTIKTGIELYGNAPQEEKKDFNKPDRSNKLPYWVIIDTKGILNSLLHEVRRFEFCKDVIVLILDITPKKYIQYLKERDYDYHIIGKNYVNLKKALELLSKKYKIGTILTDSGRILGNHLLKQGLVSEISLLIHPIIVGDKSYNIFNALNKKLQLKLLKNENLDKGYLWIVYKTSTA
jgi:2,5-diamino-6-(ribosylamino)-4(3H)-pyrimidinone 5'-phosphate reductase